MIKVKVTTEFGKSPSSLLRQSPKGDGVWGNYKFFIDENIKECDYWVVLDGIGEPKESICRKGGVILIMGEPATVKKYDKKFSDQFDHIVTNQKSADYKGVIYDQPSIPWFVGQKYDFKREEWLESYSKGYDELKNIQSVEKTKLASVICSDKAGTTGQRKRLRFLKELNKKLGDRIDFFGKGFRPISDKWDAIASYKYHICLENTATEDYWTEKISDAFLGLSHPIYWGCVNIGDYFPEGSYSYIDIIKPKEATQEIGEIINSNIYENNIENIKESKSLILDTYNFFPHVVSLIEKTIRKNNFADDKEVRKIYPEKKSVDISISRVLRSQLFRKLYCKTFGLKK